MVLSATGGDLVVINSGTFRSDMVHPAGDFTMRDLANVIPMRDPLVVLEVTGTQILEILENGVFMYPKLEGRFPQVAGISFAFDPRKTPGERVDPYFVRIGDEYLVKEQKYRLATKSYMKTGCDGYLMLKKCPIIVDEDECPELGLAVQNHFQAINVRLGKTKKHSKHRQSLVTLSRRHSLVKMLDPTAMDFDGPPPIRRASVNEPGLHSTGSPGSPNTPINAHKLSRRASLDDLEQQSCQLTPRTDKRIIIINSEDVSIKFEGLSSPQGS